MNPAVVLVFSKEPLQSLNMVLCQSFGWKGNISAFRLRAHCCSRLAHRYTGRKTGHPAWEDRYKLSSAIHYHGTVPQNNLGVCLKGSCAMITFHLNTDSCQRKWKQAFITWNWKSTHFINLNIWLLLSLQKWHEFIRLGRFPWATPISHAGFFTSFSRSVFMYRNTTAHHPLDHTSPFKMQWGPGPKSLERIPVKRQIESPSQNGTEQQKCWSTPTPTRQTPRAALVFEENSHTLTHEISHLKQSCFVAAQTCGCKRGNYTWPSININEQPSSKMDAQHWAKAQLKPGPLIPFPWPAWEQSGERKVLPETALYGRLLKSVCNWHHYENRSGWLFSISWVTWHLKLNQRSLAPNVCQFQRKFVIKALAFPKMLSLHFFFFFFFKWILFR